MVGPVERDDVVSTSRYNNPLQNNIDEHVDVFVSLYE